MDAVQIENIEIDLLAEALYRRYGFDFRNYARASMARRVRKFCDKNGHGTPSQLIPVLIHDRAQFSDFLLEVSVTVTELFRDPPVYRAIRQHVLPFLGTFPHIRIWHAGCATGEEVYTMAILLQEAGLYDKTIIYATDINTRSMETAKNGIYPADRIKQYTANYQQAGGSGSFSDYYHAKYGSAVMDGALKRNIVFAGHNLASDAVFAQMHFIMCRNVLIYFNQTLQDRALELFHDSLVLNGMLCLGTKENIRFSDSADKFGVVAEKEKIYQKLSQGSAI